MLALSMKAKIEQMRKTRTRQKHPAVLMQHITQEQDHTVFFGDSWDGRSLGGRSRKRRRGGGSVLRSRSCGKIIDPPILDVLFLRHGILMRVAEKKAMNKSRRKRRKNGGMVKFWRSFWAL